MKVYAILLLSLIVAAFGKEEETEAFCDKLKPKVDKDVLTELNKDEKTFEKEARKKCKRDIKIRFGGPSNKYTPQEPDETGGGPNENPDGGLRGRELSRGHKKLKNVEQGKCIDFIGNDPRGRLVDCGSATTAFHEETISGNFKRYRIHRTPSSLPFHHTHYLDSWYPGAYVEDGTNWQKWYKRDLGGRFRLQDWFYYEYLDDGYFIEMTEYDDWCGTFTCGSDYWWDCGDCQHWQLV